MALVRTRWEPLAAAIGALALVGCVGLPPADGMFSVSGSLPASLGPCDLLLFSEEGVEIPFSRRKVRGKFRENFAVAPQARMYQVGVQCGSAISKVATIRYGTLVAPGDAVVLGEIAP
jgi:hypothetical protein